MNSENNELTANLPTVEGIDWAPVLERFQDKNLVLFVVHDYLKLSDQQEEILLEKYEDLMNAADNLPEKFTAYRVQAHSMKSSAATIGATALSEVAKALEFAARDEDGDKIEVLTPMFLRKWSVMTQKLKEAFPEEKIVKKTLDIARVKELLADLIAASTEMDLDRMDSLSEELVTYDLPAEFAKTAEDLSYAVFQINYDKCTALSQVLLDKLA